MPIIPSVRTPPAAPPLTLAQARALDVQAARHYGVATRLLMENAGAQCAQVAKRLWRSALRRSATGRGRSRGRRHSLASVLVFCGTGGNGGDGYVLARHLLLAGVPVRVVATGLPKPGSDAADARRSWLAVKGGTKTAAHGAAPGRTGTHAGGPARCAPPALVVDAILGTGVCRPVTGAAARAVRRINELRAEGARVLAIDLPSGLDTDTGEVHGVAVKADATVTIAARKRGLTLPASRAFRGRVVVVPFGAPAEPLPTRRRTARIRRTPRTRARA